MKLLADAFQRGTQTSMLFLFSFQRENGYFYCKQTIDQRADKVEVNRQSFVYAHANQGPALTSQRRYRLPPPCCHKWWFQKGSTLSHSSSATAENTLIILWIAVCNCKMRGVRGEEGRLWFFVQHYSAYCELDGQGFDFCFDGQGVDFCSRHQQTCMKAVSFSGHLCREKCTDLSQVCEAGQEGDLQLTTISDGLLERRIILKWGTRFVEQK
jgi:hypothetical protein